MKTTIKDVARFAKVSPATVSLVMNQKPGVNEETRKKVLEAIKLLEYRPNQIARSLIKKKSSTIGLIVTNIDNPFYGELVYYMQKEIDKTNYNLILGITNDSVELERKAVESMISRDVEGVFLVPSRDGEHELGHLYQLRTVGIPLVFLTSAYMGIQADCVMADLAEGMYQLTKYLLSKGERKIYFLTEKRSLLLSATRIAGYERAFFEAGEEYHPQWIVEENPTVENGILVTEKILQSDKPDAIITLNAIMSLGVLKSLRDHALLVPEEISVACFDESAYSAVLYTPMTTIRQPMPAIAKRAIAVLEERISGGRKAYETEFLPTEMIVRNSTK